VHYFFENDDTYLWRAEQDDLTARSQSVSAIEGAYAYKIAWTNTLSGTITFTHKELTLEKKALVTHSPAEELIYDRIWVTSLIQFGLISETRTSDIEVWNSFFVGMIGIEEFTDPADAGISIETITPPVYISANGYETYEVTVSAAGPAEQNTTFEWVINSLDFSTLVTGTRLIPFPFMIEWGNGETIIYEYHTSVYGSKTTHEQRRGLIDACTRQSIISLLLTDIEAQSLANLVRYAIGKYWAVPIYCEAVKPSISLLGADSITTSEDLTYHWNLNNYSDYVTIFDTVSREIEVKSVSTVSSSQIALETIITGTYDINTTKVMPTYVGILAGFSLNQTTDSVQQVNLRFQEVRISGF